MATKAGYDNIVFAFFSRDGDGYEGKLYYLKDIFNEESNPNNFKYGTGKMLSVMMVEASLIQLAWEPPPPPNLPLNRSNFRRMVATLL